MGPYKFCRPPRPLATPLPPSDSKDSWNQSESKAPAFWLNQDLTGASRLSTWLQLRPVYRGGRNLRFRFSHKGDPYDFGEILRFGDLGPPVVENWALPPPVVESCIRACSSSFLSHSSSDTEMHLQTCRENGYFEFSHCHLGGKKVPLGSEGKVFTPPKQNKIGFYEVSP